MGLVIKEIKIGLLIILGAAFSGPAIEAFSSESVIQSTLVAKNSSQETGPRDFYEPMHQSDQDDIRYIVRTLANCSLIKIGASESALKRAGDRIEHVHPLKFLEFVFADEELKICMRNVQGRAWVWKEFVNGLTGSLAYEASLGNLTGEQVAEFAAAVKVSTQILTPIIQRRSWRELIDTLIAHVPRKKGSDRYNM